MPSRIESTLELTTSCIEIHDILHIGKNSIVLCEEFLCLIHSVFYELNYIFCLVERKIPSNLKAKVSISTLR